MYSGHYTSIQVHVQQTLQLTTSTCDVGSGPPVPVPVLDPDPRYTNMLVYMYVFCTDVECPLLMLFVATCTSSTC